MAEDGEPARNSSSRPLSETEAEVRITGLSRDRLGEAAVLLAGCFHDNPNFVALFPDGGPRARALPRMFAVGLRDAAGFGHVYGATRAVPGSASEVLVGVAAWLPPGAFPLSVPRRVRALPGLAGVMAAAPRSALRLLGYTTEIERSHPAQPCWYLEVVGVNPDARGLGIGTRLLEPVLALADSAERPCYLETMTERNVAWYRTLGFEVREAGVRFVSGGPTNWTMLRPPVRARATHDRFPAGPSESGEAAS